MKKYESVQYLRAIAALLVVFHHARNPVEGYFNPLATFDAGSAGVDVFFVISGFIMYAAARDEPPLEFVRRRLVRVVPLYWMATLALAVVFLKNGVLALDSRFVGEIAQSLLFVPHYSLLDPTEIWPFLTPGWTLNYEMFFYAVFALGLASRRLIPFVATIILAMVALGAAVKTGGAVWLTYTNPLLLEFLAGLLIGGEWVDGPRVLVWGVPAVLMVVGAITLEAQGRLPAIPALRTLGDASYSIYLFHGFATGKLDKFRAAIPLEGLAHFLAIVLLGLAGSVLLGLAVYFLVERPLLRILSPRRQRRTAAA